MIDEKQIGTMIGHACGAFAPIILALMITDRRDIARRIYPHVLGLAGIATELAADPKLDQAFAAVRDAFEKIEKE